MEVILNSFQKTSNSFYFQDTLTLLHFVLIKRFLIMSHVDTKIRRPLIPSQLSEQFQTLTKSLPLSLLGEKIYKIKIIPWCVTQFLSPVMVSLLTNFFWYNSHPILCHFATVLPTYRCLLVREIIKKIILMIRGFLLSIHKIHANIVEWYVP